MLGAFVLEEDLVALLMEQYAAGYECVKRDVEDFLHELEEQGILQKRSIARGSELHFWNLVKCGLDRMKPHPEYFYMLNAEDWEMLYRLVQKQAVTGICFSAAELLPPGMRKAARLLSGH